MKNANLEDVFFATLIAVLIASAIVGVYQAKEKQNQRNTPPQTNIIAPHNITPDGVIFQEAGRTR